MLICYTPLESLVQHRDKLDGPGSRLSMGENQTSTRSNPLYTDNHADFFSDTEPNSECTGTVAWNLVESGYRNTLRLWGRAHQYQPPREECGSKTSAKHPFLPLPKSSDPGNAGT